MSISRRLLAILVVILTAATAAGAYNVCDSLRARFDHRVVLPVEGVWQWTDGAVLMIEAADGPNNLIITLLESPDPAIATPADIGTGRTGAKKGEYVFRMVSDPAKGIAGISGRTPRYVARVSADGRLALTPYSTGVNVKVNLWRALPYLGRVSVTRDKAPDGIDGGWRLYPPAPNELNPIVL